MAEFQRDPLTPEQIDEFLSGLRTRLLAARDVVVNQAIEKIDITDPSASYRTFAPSSSFSCHIEIDGGAATLRAYDETRHIVTARRHYTMVARGSDPKVFSPYRDGE